MATDLTLVPLEDLMAEIFARHDCGLIALYKDLDAKASAEVTKFKGNYRMVQGLAAGAVVAIETATLPSRIEADPT
jgi:hypothetical protein